MIVTVSHIRQVCVPYGPSDRDCDPHPQNRRIEEEQRRVAEEHREEQHRLEAGLYDYG